MALAVSSSLLCLLGVTLLPTVSGGSKIPNPYIIGTVIGSILPVIICVGLIICCVCPCCCLYKRFRRNRNHNHNAVIVASPTTHTTLVTTPWQPPQATPGGHPQSYPRPVYQSMPLQPLQPGFGVQPMMPQGQGYGPPMPSGHGPSMPSAPSPSYMEVGDPGYPSPSVPYSNAAFSEGQDMYPLQPPTQPNAPTPYSDERAIPPSYNPSY